MRWVIGLLWCVTLLAQVSTGKLPWMTPDRWFYILRGLEGTTLYLTLTLLLPVLRSRLQQIALLTLIPFGATMEALTSICGLVFYWGKGPTPVLITGTLCDSANQQTMTWTVAAVSLSILVVILTYERRRRGPDQ